MAGCKKTQTPTKNKRPRKRSNESADRNPAKTKRRRTRNLKLLAIPGPDEPECTIFEHLHSLELVESKRRPLSGYMEKVQEDINPDKRTKLVDWLIDVAQDFRLASDTLYLTVNYIDRFLSTRKVVGKKLKLLGVSCMLVASKYEEVSPPKIEAFCLITENTYTKKEVVRMEREIFKALDFEMSKPTTKTFLRLFQEHENSWVLSKSRRRLEFLCDYITELSLTDYYSCAGYIPSTVAASAIFLARFILQPECHPWTPALQEDTGYEAFELKGCVLRLHNLLYTSETSVRALRHKYMDCEFKYVASMSPPLEIPASFFQGFRKLK